MDVTYGTAQATYDNKTETFQRDGLALIQCNEVNYVNEPYATCGNPILSGDKALFNDPLDTTLGVKSGNDFAAIKRDAFGQTANQFFNGKPYIGEMGYTFLFRNYRVNQGKRQLSAPLGDPDGGNNVAYVNHGITAYVDFCGGWELKVDNTGGFVVSVKIDGLTWSFSGGVGRSGISPYLLIQPEGSTETPIILDPITPNLSFDSTDGVTAITNGNATVKVPLMGYPDMDIPISFSSSVAADGKSATEPYSYRLILPDGSVKG